MHSGENESISQSVTDIQEFTISPGKLNRDLKQMNNTNQKQAVQYNTGMGWCQIFDSHWTKWMET